MMTLAYLRVSRREQALDGHGLDAQQSSIQRYAEFKGFGDVEFFVDAGVSASVPLANRPEGARLLSRIEQLFRSQRAEAPRKPRKGGNGRKALHPVLRHEEGGFVAVVAAKLDRLFRDASDCLSVTAAWDAAGVGLHLLDMGLDTSSPLGRAFLTMAAAFAELERNLIVERTVAGLEAARDKGVHLGRPPLGFARGEDKCLVLDPKRIDCARRLVELRLRKGLSLRATATQMNAEGWPTSRGAAEWGASSVRDAINGFARLSEEHQMLLERKEQRKASLEKS